MKEVVTSIPWNSKNVSSKIFLFFKRPSWELISIKTLVVLTIYKPNYKKIWDSPNIYCYLGKNPFFSPNVKQSHVLHWCTSIWLEDVKTFIWNSIWIYLGGWIIGFKYLWLHLFNGKSNILYWRICFWMVFNLIF